MPGLSAVEAQVNEIMGREELRRALDGILDLERLLSRVTLETANPRDVLALAASLRKIPGLRVALATLLNRPSDRPYMDRSMNSVICGSVSRKRLFRSRRFRWSMAAQFRLLWTKNSMNCAILAATASNFWRRSNSGNGSALESIR